MLIYQEVGIYLKYYKPQSLLKIVKMGKKLMFRKNFAMESAIFFKNGGGI